MELGEIQDRDRLKNWLDYTIAVQLALCRACPGLERCRTKNPAVIAPAFELSNSKEKYDETIAAPVEDIQATLNKCWSHIVGLYGIFKEILGIDAEMIAISLLSRYPTVRDDLKSAKILQ